MGGRAPRADRELQPGGAARLPDASRPADDLLRGRDGSRLRGLRPPHRSCSDEPPRGGGRRLDRPRLLPRTGRRPRLLRCRGGSLDPPRAGHREPAREAERCRGRRRRRRRGPRRRIDRLPADLAAHCGGPACVGVPERRGRGGALEALAPGGSSRPRPCPRASLHDVSRGGRPCRGRPVVAGSVRESVAFRGAPSSPTAGLHRGR